MTINTTSCPICQGSGRIVAPATAGYDAASAKRIMARALHANGYSLRQISALCGWKSPRSAFLAVKDQKCPCGECHLQDAEICDICGAEAPEPTSHP